jgi:hypothetical protein
MYIIGGYRQPFYFLLQLAKKIKKYNISTKILTKDPFPKYQQSIYYYQTHGKFSIHQKYFLPRA